MTRREPVGADIRVWIETVGVAHPPRLAVLSTSTAPAWRGEKGCAHRRRFPEQVHPTPWLQPPCIFLGSFSFGAILGGDVEERGAYSAKGVAEGGVAYHVTTSLAGIGTERDGFFGVQPDSAMTMWLPRRLRTKTS